MTLTSRARYWLIPLPLLGLLGVTYWLNQQAQTETPEQASGKRHEPDAIVEGFSAVRLNVQGAPHFIMAAKRMQHYPDDDSTTLEMPRISSLSAQRPAIHAIARNGTISSKGDEVFLRGNVEILREASAQQSLLTLQTEYLHIIPDQDLMVSDRAVTIANARNTIHATDLEMNNNLRTIKLLSQVKSEHAPANK